MHSIQFGPVYPIVRLAFFDDFWKRMTDKNCTYRRTFYYKILKDYDKNELRITLGLQTYR